MGNNKRKSIILTFFAFALLFFTTQKVNAEVISYDSENTFFGFSFNNNTELPLTYSIPTNTTLGYNFYLYNYDGINRPWTYVLLSVCAGGPVNSWYLSNTSYNSHYFEEASFTTYQTSNSCSVNGFGGTLYFIQFQVGRYYDYDGTGADIYVASKLNMYNNFSYNVYYTLKTLYLSNEDVITSIANDSKVLNSFTRLENGLVELDEGLSEINTSLGYLDSKLQYSNQRLDEINTNQKDTNTKLEESNKLQSETNSKLEESNKLQSETNDYIKDDTAPNADISALGNVQGLLPEGPVDSLLNIPFMFLSVITSSMGGVCVPMEFGFVFDSKLTLPCFSEQFYNDVPELLMNFLSLIPSAFILIKYFKHLYKKVDRAVSMDSNADDQWGAI